MNTRLKPKLGNRSNASSEVELDGAWAKLIGEEGRGVATIMDMVQQTRLDCVLASTALMRRGLWKRSITPPTGTPSAAP
jgi:putative acyl-CoA dehydrogenase